LPAISAINPEVCDIDPADMKRRQSYTTTVTRHLRQLGIEELILLRGLDICEFTFGYTRVGSTPSTTIKDLEMPVRLCAFDYVERKKRPIYLLEQKNEGFYIKLSERRVTEWLSRNALGEHLPPRDGMRLGGLLVEEYCGFRSLPGKLPRTRHTSYATLRAQLHLSSPSYDGSPFRTCRR
jgi:hypothetical protein